VSTEENLICKPKEQQLFTPLLALLFFLLASKSNWIWQNLYFQLHSTREIIYSLILMVMVVVIFYLSIFLVMSKTIALRFIDFGLVTLSAYVGFTFLKQAGFIPEPTTDLFKISAIIAVVALYFFIIKINIEKREKLYIAIILGGLLFVLLPVMLVNLNSSKIYWPSPSTQEPTVPGVNISKQNTIILLLDELSASVAATVVEPLAEEGLKTQLSNIESIGKNTQNVIPAIWTRKNFNQSVPCGPTHLCSGTDVLNFANVWATSDSIDVVGFYHQYCAMQGLRSCTFENMPKLSAEKDLICSFPVIKSIDYLQCDYSLIPNEKFTALRKNMEDSVFNAPFWEDGGILYAHLLVPHPLIGSPVKKLSEEYRDNLENSAALVKLVAQKAKLAFDDDFKIIIFSDHPLRRDIWCSHTGYIKLGCEPDALQISTQVPLIIATPTATQQPTHSVTNNKFVFDLLF
jgi:hypothetical protein